MSPARKSWRRSVGRGSGCSQDVPLANRSPPTARASRTHRITGGGCSCGSVSWSGDHARTGHHGERPQASGAAHLRGIRRQPQGSRVRGLLQDGELRRIRGPPAAAASRPARVAARQDRTHRSDPSARAAGELFGKRSVALLPGIGAGEIHDRDPLHQAAALSPTNLRRIQVSRPGGTWRDWNEDLVADRHKRGSGRTYPSVYGRMTWDDPAPTMTTQFHGFGKGRFGHPEQDRRLPSRGSDPPELPAALPVHSPGGADPPQDRWETDRQCCSGQARIRHRQKHPETRRRSQQEKASVVAFTQWRI